MHGGELGDRSRLLPPPGHPATREHSTGSSSSTPQAGAPDEGLIRDPGHRRGSTPCGQGEHGDSERAGDCPKPHAWRGAALPGLSPRPATGLLAPPLTLLLLLTSVTGRGQCLSLGARQSHKGLKTALPPKEPPGHARPLPTGHVAVSGTPKLPQSTPASSVTMSQHRQGPAVVGR